MKDNMINQSSSNIYPVKGPPAGSFKGALLGVIDELAPRWAAGTQADCRRAAEIILTGMGSNLYNLPCGRITPDAFESVRRYLQNGPRVRAAKQKYASWIKRLTMELIWRKGLPVGCVVIADALVRATRA